MIPPLLYVIPRLLLFVIPIFITLKTEEKRNAPLEKHSPDSDPGEKDT
jgi:hypothetical protein